MLEPFPQVVVNYVAKNAKGIFDNSLQKGKPYDIRCRRVCPYHP